MEAGVVLGERELPIFVVRVAREATVENFQDVGRRHFNHARNGASHVVLQPVAASDVFLQFVIGRIGCFGRDAEVDVDHRQHVLAGNRDGRVVQFQNHVFRAAGLGGRGGGAHFRGRNDAFLLFVLVGFGVGAIHRVATDADQLPFKAHALARRHQLARNRRDDVAFVVRAQLGEEPLLDQIQRDAVRHLDDLLVDFSLAAGFDLRAQGVPAAF